MQGGQICLFIIVATMVVMITATMAVITTAVILVHIVTVSLAATDLSTIISDVDTVMAIHHGYLLYFYHLSFLAVWMNVVED